MENLINHKSGYHGADSMRDKAEKLIRDEMAGVDMHFPRSASQPGREKIRLYKKGGHVKGCYDEGGPVKRPIMVSPKEHDEEMNYRIPEGKEGKSHYKKGGHAKAKVTSPQRRAMKGRERDSKQFPNMPTPPLNEESIHGAMRMKKGGKPPEHMFPHGNFHPQNMSHGGHHEVHHHHHYKKGGAVKKAHGGHFEHGKVDGESMGHGEHRYSNSEMHYEFPKRLHKAGDKPAYKEGGHVGKHINYEDDFVGEGKKGKGSYESWMMGEKCVKHVDKSMGDTHKKGYYKKGGHVANPNHGQVFGNHAEDKHPNAAQHTFKKGGKVKMAMGGVGKIRHKQATSKGLPI